MSTNYDFWRIKLQEVKNFTDKSLVLSKLFTPKYYDRVLSQIDNMEKQEKIGSVPQSGPLNSIFIFLVDDTSNEFIQTNLLESYISLIFSHPTARKSDREYIVAQIGTPGSTDMLFEVSILGNLIKQLPSEKIELYPKTMGGHNVEARIFLVDRWVYLEVTAINDTASEVRAIELLLNSKIHVSSGGFVDFERDRERYIGKLQYKSPQFIPGQPNVLVLSTQGTKPLFINPPFQEPDPSIKVDNIGLVMQFNRTKMTRHKNANCDPACSLTNAEIEKLRELLTNSNFKLLSYGVA